MKNIEQVIRSSGGRLTQIRRALIEILSAHYCLLSRKEILEKLALRKIYPDRSTLYRELLFLTANNIAQKNVLSGIEYYEIPREHHHHLICLACQKIIRVDFCNQLKKQEKEIGEKNNFNILNHSLEFYGYCRKCQNKNI